MMEKKRNKREEIERSEKRVDEHRRGGRGTHFKCQQKKIRAKSKQSKAKQTNEKAEKKGFCRPILVTAAAVVSKCLGDVF